MVGVREQDQFRAVSLRTNGLKERYSPRSRLLDLSDRMELAMGRTAPPLQPWGDREALERRLDQPSPPPQLWLASSGPRPILMRKLKPMRQSVERFGYRCTEQGDDLTHAVLLQCRSGSRVLPP